MDIGKPGELFLWIHRIMTEDHNTIKQLREEVKFKNDVIRRLRAKYNALRNSPLGRLQRLITWPSRKLQAKKDARKSKDDA